MINTAINNYLDYDPVPEDSFLINLDTRTIIPPNSFEKDKNNYPIIAVKGDQLSETICFQCNRYFDNIDLSNNVFIYCQWKNQESGLKGISECKLVPTSNPQTIRFIWSLSNSSTSAQGQLIFSIRFMSYDNDNNIRYSLSTKNCIAIIENSLDYAWPDGEGNTNNYIEEFEILDGTHFTTAFKVVIDGGKVGEI